MKVLLIYPDEPQERYSSYSKVGSYIPPLGIAYIGAVLEKDGHKVKILDNTILQWPVEKIVKAVKKNKPGCVGFSATSIMLTFAKKVAEGIKKDLPDTPLILGGPGVTADKKIIFNSVFDFGVYGEGEYSFSELISALENKKNYQNIKGLIINKKNKKKVNNPRP